MKIRFILLAMLVMISSVSIAQERDKRKNRSEKLKAQKVAYITSNLDLTVEESEKFWPIYNKFQDELRALRDNGKRPRVSSEMTDEEAKDFINKGIEYEEKALSLRKVFINDISEVLPMVKVARLEVIEKEYKRRMLDRIRERYKHKKSGKDRRP